MKFVKAVLSELAGMFVADGRLSMATLAVVVACAVLIDALEIEPLLAGAVLLVGCLVLLVESVLRSRRRNTPG